MAERRADPKVEALRAERSLNPRPEAVSDEAFASSEFLDARDLVQVKYEMVRRVRVDGDAVSGAARAFGVSRPTFYDAQSALDAGGLAAWVRIISPPTIGRVSICRVTPAPSISIPTPLRRKWCCGREITSHAAAARRLLANKGGRNS